MYRRMCGLDLIAAMPLKLRKFRLLVLLWAAILGLPMAFFEYRLEPYECEADVCTVGIAGDLLVPLGTEFYPEAGPSAIRYEAGIFVRPEIPPLLAAIGGLLSPVILLIAAMMQSSRSARDARRNV